MIYDRFSRGQHVFLQKEILGWILRESAQLLFLPDLCKWDNTTLSGRKAVNANDASNDAAEKTSSLCAVSVCASSNDLSCIH